MPIHILAQNRREGLLEVAGRDAAQVRTGSSASRLLVRRAHFGRIAELNRAVSLLSAPRSRTFGRRTGIGPTPAEAARDALEAFDAEWGRQYPSIAQAWRRAWEEVIP